MNLPFGDFSGLYCPDSAGTTFGNSPRRIDHWGSSCAASAPSGKLSHFCHCGKRQVRTRRNTSTLLYLFVYLFACIPRRLVSEVTARVRVGPNSKPQISDNCFTEPFYGVGNVTPIFVNITSCVISNDRSEPGIFQGFPQNSWQARIEFRQNHSHV